MRNNNDKNMTNMERFIEMTDEKQVKALAEELGITPNMVHRCLNYKVEKDIAYKVRYRALEMGGVPMITAPECETIHDADGFMRQYFENGAQIMVDKKVGRVTLITPDGDVRVIVNSDCTVHELMRIQEDVEKMHG